MADLTDDEKALLGWLDEDGPAPYAERRGKALDGLIAKGFAVLSDGDVFARSKTSAHPGPETEKE